MTGTEGDAGGRIDALDTGLFTLESSTTEKDRTSLLRAQRLVRRRSPGYRYVEIGVFRGGSLVPHLLDPTCAGVTGIDARPAVIGDERARSFLYHGFTTATMVEDLAGHCGRDRLVKLRTLDADVSELEPGQLGDGYGLALIDGEHTNVAAFSDFMGVYRALRPDAIVLFHDANLVIDAIRCVQRFLLFSAVAHRIFILPDVVAALALGGSIPAAEAAFGPHAVDEVAFQHEAKRAVQVAIAESVRDGLNTTTFGFEPRTPFFLDDKRSSSARSLPARFVGWLEQRARRSRGGRKR